MTDSNKVETTETTELEKEATSIFQGIINFIVFIIMLKVGAVLLFLGYVGFLMIFYPM